MCKIEIYTIMKKKQILIDITLSKYLKENAVKSKIHNA